MAAVLLTGIVLTPPRIARAQDAASIDAKLANIEKNIAVLIEGQKALNKRIDDLRAEMNGRFAQVDGRFAQMTSEMNGRFAEVDGRFGDFKFWLQIIVGLLIAIIGAVIVEWNLVWKRLFRVEAELDIMKNKRIQELEARS